MKRTLYIFEHKKGFFISVEHIVLIFLTGLLIILGYLQLNEYFNFGNLVIYIGIIWFLCFLGITISNLFLHEHENGEYKGKLEFEPNAVIINEIRYELEEINKISIHSSDYEGVIHLHRTFSIYRNLSNGLNNEFTLDLVNGNKIKCNFFQSKGQRIKNYKNILTKYHLKEKISWLHLLEVLEIEDYDEIQRFKRNLNRK